MRRCAEPMRFAPMAALLGLLALPGCHYVSSPLAGAGGFLGNTHSFAFDPNRPPGMGENMARVAGRDADVEPLLPELGNVWPGPIPADPTLTDLQRQQSEASPPPASTPYAPHPQPRPSRAPSGGAGGSGSTGAPPPLFTQPSGAPLVPGASSGGVTTATTPGGGTSIIVPNGNGTSTVIGPDGSTQTLPTPK